MKIAFQLNDSLPPTHLLCAALIISLCLFTTSSLAATGGGIDTPEGVTVLPLSVQGIEGLGLVTTGTDTPPNTVILGNVGVGTATPVNKFDVYGNVAIGTSYAGVAAPDNGLAVQGKVGVGTTAPQAMLDVKGSIKTGTATIGQACSPEGILAYDIASHAPVYCNVSGVWASTSGGSGTLSCSIVTGSGTATCGSGYTMTGGGCYRSGFVQIAASFPSSSSSWYCLVHDGIAHSYAGTAYAICCH